MEWGFEFPSGTPAATSLTPPFGQGPPIEVACPPDIDTPYRSSSPLDLAPLMGVCGWESVEGAG